MPFEPCNNNLDLSMSSMHIQGLVCVCQGSQGLMSAVVVAEFLNLLTWLKVYLHKQLMCKMKVP